MSRATLLHVALTQSILLVASDYIKLSLHSNEPDLQTTGERMQCFSKILKRHVPRGSTVTAVSAGGASDDVIKSINNENCYNIVTRCTHAQNWPVAADVCVVSVNDASELTARLAELAMDSQWNPGGRFIITIDDSTYDNVTAIFDELLKRKIYDVILYFVKSNEAVTYYPFANNNCGKWFDELVHLDHCNDVVAGDVVVAPPVVHDYRGCSLVVGVKEVIPYVIMSKTSNKKLFQKYNIGLEQMVLENIAALEGIEIVYKTFSSDEFRGVVLTNNTATGMLSYLQSGEISVVAGGYTLILNRVRIFDFIWGYNYASYKIVTRAPKDTVWAKVYREFSVQSWTLIAASMGIMCAVTLLIIKCLSDKHEDPIIVVLKILEYFLDHSAESLVTNRKLRFLLLIWIWYTYFINSFYKTAYYSLITGHVKEYRDFNWYNLSSLPFEPCVSEYGKRFFLYAYNLTFPNAKFIQECENIENSLDFVAEKQNFYAFATEYTFYGNAYKYIDEAGNFKLDGWDILDATISTFYCNRGFTLKRTFQKHAMRIFESGLIQVHLNVMNVKRKHLTQSNNKYFTTLILGDFRVAYCVLTGGVVGSFICFLFERRYIGRKLK